MLAGAADGIVPGLGNVDPHGYVRLYEAARSGDTAAAQAEQRLLTELFSIIQVADRGRAGRMSGALGAFKAALVARGVIRHPYTQAPLLPLTDAESRAVADRVAAAGLGPVG